MPDLFTPLSLGDYTLKNRVVMAPLSRSRANSNGVPQPISAQYYRQRASAGLIIAEATATSPTGRGWINGPGIYTREQIAGWQQISEEVHRDEGVIFVQLWHMGAAVHPDFLGGNKPVSASQITLEGTLPTPIGRDRPFKQARSLSKTEIRKIIAEFAQAAKNAIAAGLDGIELHAANSFLIDQFTRDGSNLRTDEYGGSIDNRLRFLSEVTDAVCDAIGSGKVGIRLSPSNEIWQVKDSQYRDTYARAVELLNPLDLAYLHLLEPRPDSGHDIQTIDYQTPDLRQIYNGILISNGGHSAASAKQMILNGGSDAVSFGKPFIANPDLVERFRHGWPLNIGNRSTYYTNGPEGYIDYPTFTAEASSPV
ncbi:alkene reductase [Microbulbifer sp. TRSA001]|uniref:alkene reductase n=1 Tax=Microbulbifer sp. TRSA001 TaxID=3243381 RepID=UPI0040399DED